MPRIRAELRAEQGSKRVRGYAGGELVFDTTRPVLVWEVPTFPAYYIPEADVIASIAPTGQSRPTPDRGQAEAVEVRLGDGRRVGIAWRFPSAPSERLRQLVRFDWSDLDEWLEEDEPVYTHPRDPYTRVDILRSSRHVQVVIDGVKVAESSRPTILFETGLPPRFYLPLSDVRMELLRPSATRSHCPYKGEASYWSLEIDGVTHEDLVWTYRSPLTESQKIEGLACFYNERADLYVDGELQRRPRTKFSGSR